MIYPKTPRKLTPEELEMRERERIELVGIKAIAKQERLKRLTIYAMLAIVVYFFSDFIKDVNTIPDNKESEVIFITILYLSVGSAQGYVGGVMYRFIKSKKMKDEDYFIVIPTTAVLFLYQIFSGIEVVTYFTRTYNITLIGLCVFMLQWILLIMTLLSDDGVTSVFNNERKHKEDG